MGAALFAWTATGLMPKGRAIANALARICCDDRCWRSERSTNADDAPQHAAFELSVDNSLVLSAASRSSELEAGSEAEYRSMAEL